MNLYEALKIIFTKKGELDKTWSPVIVNKFLSMSSIEDAKIISIELNNYVFWIHQDMLEKLYMNLIPKQRPPFIRYIKAQKEIEQEYDFILKEAQTYFHWTNNELKANKHIILKQLENKETLKRLLFFIGADMTILKKYNITIEKPKDPIRTLDSWMK